VFWKRATRLVPLLAAGLLAATASPALAGAVDPVAIGPHQYFVGVVNGQTGSAVIHMACYGPLHPGQTGHPMPGQTVEVRRAAVAAKSMGYTGGGADEIVVGAGTISSSAKSLALHYYGEVVEIPTTLTLPCYGGYDVAFVPLPTSWTARPATVRVDFVGLP
jgi:hypothetical protein